MNHNGPGAGTAPLAVNKKNRKPGDKENPSAVLCLLKPAQPATAKVHGLLQQREVLPDVVIRLPLLSDHTGFGYMFC